jgi:WD40 repeat protein
LKEKQERTPDFLWLKALRPPAIPLGGSLRSVLTGHAAEVTAVAVTPDGQRVVSGDRDGSVRVWDFASGAELFCLTTFQGRIHQLVMAPEGRSVAVADESPVVRLIDVETGETAVAWYGHQGPVWHVAFAPGGQALLTGSQDGTLRLWDRAGHEVACSPPHPQGWFHSIWLMGGRYLLAIAGSGKGYLFAMPVFGNPQEIDPGRPLGGAVTLPDGRVVLSSGGPFSEPTLYLWDPQEGTVEERGDGVGGGRVAIVPPGVVNYHRLLYSYLGQWCLLPLELFPHLAYGDLRDQNLPVIPSEQVGGVSSLVVSQDGRWIITGCGDHTVRIWHTDPRRANRYQGRLQGRFDPIQCLRFPSDGSQLLAGCGHGRITLWDPRTGRHQGEFRVPVNIKAVAVAPDLRRLAVGGIIGLYVLDRGTGQAIPITQEFGLEALAWSPDGTWLVAGTGLMVRHIDLGRGPVANVEVPSRVTGVAVSAAGTEVWCACEDGVARRYDVASWQLRDELEFRPPYAWRPEIAVSADHQRLGVQTGNRTTHVWHLGHRQDLAAVEDVEYLARHDFMPRWRLLAFAGESAIQRDGVAVAWLPFIEDFRAVTTPQGPVWATLTGGHLQFYHPVGSR